ncbi:MAG: hypothetical protein QOJ70_3577 [Acidobacteriota bacterium]|jgi:hypothetical protein|nr:hypothetical protein [Acidobacteriota bacterium]
MTLRQSIQRVITQILNENASTGGKSPTAEEVQRRAQAAIAAGQGKLPNITTEWEAYMTYLLTAADATGTAADPTQLARLKPIDGTTDPMRQMERAYLVANGVCGTTTTDHLLDGNTTAELDKP